ncbi:MAG: YesN/AraC family two-component response regulator [Paraglaciecola sp.]|jgi:YesN/AraC family two-component response regulator
MTVNELESIFDRIIEKLKFELGKESEIQTKSCLYRLIPTEIWNQFAKLEDWNSASEINLCSLDDDVEELEKLAKNEDRACTYVSFDRIASLLREVSQVNNPI